MRFFILEMTGHSTGSHVHFELQQNGVPTNPFVHPAIGPPQMRGGDLARFLRTVARDLDEARHDGVALTGAQ